MTKNQIMTVPTSGQYSSMYINAGKILNEGVEVMLYTTPVRTKDFEFNFDMSLAQGVRPMVRMYQGII